MAQDLIFDLVDKLVYNLYNIYIYVQDKTCEGMRGNYMYVV